MTPEVRGLFQGDDGRRPDGPLVIDCDRCTMRGIACDDCVVSVLLGVPLQGESFDESEQHALDVLAEAGLVPPLRMVDARESRSAEGA
jgi:hypothetical protein